MGAKLGAISKQNLFYFIYSAWDCDRFPLEYRISSIDFHFEFLLRTRLQIDPSKSITYWPLSARTTPESSKIDEKS